MNIGTPSEATVKGLKSYFKEFLSDPDVIDLNPLLRWAIVNLIVVPFRPRRVLPQYKSIWTEQGSPLLMNSEKFLAKISFEPPGNTWPGWPPAGSGRALILRSSLFRRKAPLHVHQ